MAGEWKKEVDRVNLSVWCLNPTHNPTLPVCAFVLTSVKDKRGGREGSYDFIRAITGSLILLITSLVCINWAWIIPGEVAGSIFGVIAAAVFGYDTFTILKYIKELKEQGRIGNVIFF
ncbi:unnamed protein product [Leuciscus chuanchicus]